MKHNSVLCVFFNDPSHRLNNDLQLSLASAGLWGAMLVNKIVWNARWGPWESLGWFQKIVEISDKAAQLTDHCDYVFDSFLKGIAEDLGETHRVSEDLWGFPRPHPPP